MSKMASLRGRLERLERHCPETAQHAQKELDEFLKRLSDGELRWLHEPADKAASLVPCPHVEMVSCGCRGDERSRRGLEAHPELADEFVRRYNALLERAEEIMERVPWGM
jgi:hypothetical protein